MLNRDFLGHRVNMTNCRISSTNDALVFQDNNLDSPLKAVWRLSKQRGWFKITCASKMRPVLQVWAGSHKTNPDEMSSSSTPFNLIFTFSPGPTAVTSSSSDHS